MELSVKGICKSFGASNVLSRVDFNIRGGEICALLGENGAGKSTLMNIIGGVYQADAGEILLDGKKVVFSNPAQSLRAGIAFIHQELNLINHLTVCENMFLPDFPRHGPIIDRKTMIDSTQELFDTLGINIDPRASVSSLDASYKQMVEIARAFRTKASVIIMDEPTASLTSAEIDRVFEIMNTLRSRGIAIVFISHKLNEVMQICDRFCVLRDGTMVKSGRIADVTSYQLASYMVGHDVVSGHAAQTHEDGDEILRLENLSGGESFRNISLSLRRGEILGVTGLLGDGRSEIFSSVFGLHGGKYRGNIILDGKKIHPASSSEALKHGIAYLPSNRKENAVIPDMSILDNGTIVTLSLYRRFLFLSRKAQRKGFLGQAEKLRVKMRTCDNLITTLSGGNQQKVILAKWLLSDPKVLILDNPTQGVDVGSKEEIYSIISELADAGIAIVVLSPEAQEIIRLCRRSIVLYHGEIVAEVKGEEMTEQKIMYLATGAGKEKTEHE